MDTMRYALSLALIGFLFAAVPAHAFNTKAGYDQEGAPGAITPERIKSEAEEAAQKLQDSRPRRYYFYSTYARNATEFAALAKYTVYLFMVWTQKAEELPIKRIFIRAPRGQEIPALNVMSWRMPADHYLWDELGRIGNGGAGSRAGSAEYPGTVDHSSGQRSEEHTFELQSHSFISYAVFCFKKK